MMPGAQGPECRDYGMGTAGEPQGRPWVDRQCQDPEAGCPNCGCKQVYEIKVELKAEMLKGGKGVGMYLGCPACPWASPMVAVASAAPAPGCYVCEHTEEDHGPHDSTCSVDDCACVNFYRPPQTNAKGSEN